MRDFLGNKLYVGDNVVFSRGTPSTYIEEGHTYCLGCKTYLTKAEVYKVKKNSCKVKYYSSLYEQAEKVKINSSFQLYKIGE